MFAELLYIQTFMYKTPFVMAAKIIIVATVKEPFVTMVVMVSDGDTLCKFQGFVAIYY